MKSPSGSAPHVWIVANTTWYVFNFRRPLITALQALGCNITVLSPEDEYVERLQSLGVRHVHLEMDNQGMHPVHELRLVLRLSQLFRLERPGLLLTFTPKVNIYCSLAARLNGVPAVPNVSGLGSGFIRGGWLSRIMRTLYRISFSHPYRVFFQNEDDLQVFLQGGLVTASKTERLPGSGVDVQRFAPISRPTTTPPFVFLMVARLLFDKGVREYVEAARQLRETHPQVECRLLGFLDFRNPTAVSEGELRQWQQEGSIKYLGSTDDIVPHYADADCVVLPSYREGCPRTLLEAASMARPLIATDVPGCRQVVKDGVNGLLVRLADASDLASKMAYMAELAPAERARMGLRGREKMTREFDERLVIDRYVAVVREALKI